MQIHSQNCQANYKAESVTSVPVSSLFILRLLKRLVLTFKDTQWANLQATQPLKVPKSDQICWFQWEKPPYWDISEKRQNPSLGMALKTNILLNCHPTHSKLSNQVSFRTYRRFIAFCSQGRNSKFLLITKIPWMCYQLLLLYLWTSEKVRNFDAQTWAPEPLLYNQSKNTVLAEMDI